MTSMSRTTLSAALTFMLALASVAVGRSSDDVDLHLRIEDEQAPAGGVVQMKVKTTDGEPISGGRPRTFLDTAAFSDLVGIGMFAVNGEAAGAAVIDGNRVAISYLTTEPITADPPVLAVSLRIRPDAPVGTRSQVALESPSLWSLDGVMVSARVDPGVVTVSGNTRAAISEISPGDGWYPAGTVVSVRGIGFSSRSRLKLDFDAGNVWLVSPTEMRLTLRQTTNMTGQRIRVDNPDGSRTTFYSYARGIPAATSGRPLLAKTHPVFSGTRRSVAEFGTIPEMHQRQYIALALQNPNLTSVDVTMSLYTADGALVQTASRSLQSGYRLALELSELFDGAAPPPGGSVRVMSSLPIQMFDLVCDEAAWTVTPRLAVDASSSGPGGAAETDAWRRPRRLITR